MSLVHTIQQFRCDFRRVQRDINDIQTLIIQTWLGAVNGRQWYTTARKLNELGYGLVEKFKDRLYSDYGFQRIRYALYLIMNEGGVLSDVAARFEVSPDDLQYLQKMIAGTSFSPPAIDAGTSADLLSCEQVFELIDKNTGYFKRLVDSSKFYYLSQTYVSADSLENQLFFKAWMVALRNLELDPHKLENTIKASTKNCLIDIARRHTASQRNKHMLMYSERISHGKVSLTCSGHTLCISEVRENQWQFTTATTQITIQDNKIAGNPLGYTQISIDDRWSLDKEIVYFDGKPQGTWCSYQIRKDFDLREFSLSGSTDDFIEDHNIHLIDSTAELRVEELECRLSGIPIIEGEENTDDLYLHLLAQARNYYDRDLFRQAIPLFKRAITMSRTKELVTLLADCYYECRMFYWSWRWYKQVSQDATVKLILAELRRYNFAQDIIPGQLVVYSLTGTIQYGRVVNTHKSHIYAVNLNSFIIEKINKSQIYAFHWKNSILAEDYAIKSDLNRLVCAKIDEEPPVVVRTLNAYPTGYHVLCISRYSGYQMHVRYADISRCHMSVLSVLKS